MELKFNCFFLMPVLNDFPTRLRTELETAFEEGIDAGVPLKIKGWTTRAHYEPHAFALAAVFDVNAVRSALLARSRRLQSEMDQMTRISKKFNSVWETLGVPAESPQSSSPHQFFSTKNASGRSPLGERLST